jgi:hypothetical protein
VGLIIRKNNFEIDRNIRRNFRLKADPISKYTIARDTYMAVHDGYGMYGMIILKGRLKSGFWWV